MSLSEAVAATTGAFSKQLSCPALRIAKEVLVEVGEVLGRGGKEEAGNVFRPSVCTPR